MKCSTLFLDILFFIANLLTINSTARNYIAKGFNMPEYKDPDHELYAYEDITDEDIWKYNVAEEIGVVRITEKIYNEQIFNMKPGDKPWLLTIVHPGELSKLKGGENWWHSTHCMKSLYFLKRDYEDWANYGYINTHDEFLREAFENDGLPQTIFIKDGKPYYMPWNAVGYNKMLEFMIRHEELAIDALQELHPIPNKITIYFEYYKKNIGWGFRKIEKPLLKIKIWWEARDPQLKYWPKNLMVYMRDHYFNAHPKTSGMRVLKEVLLPSCIISTTLGFLLCGCWRKKPKKGNVKVKDQ